MLLNIDSPATSKLGFEPIRTNDGELLFKGVVPATIDSVDKITVAHEKGQFAGCDVPVLRLNFISIPLNAEDPERNTSVSIKPVGTVQKVQGKDDEYETRPLKDVQANINDAWNMIKHFIQDACTYSPNARRLTDIPADVLKTVFVLPDGSVEMSGEEIVAKWNAFFDYILLFINGDATAKPMTIDAAGNALEVFVKVLPNYSTDPKKNKKWYEVGNRVGQGVFEAIKRKDKLIGNPTRIKVKDTELLDLVAGVAAPSGATGVPQPGVNNTKPAVSTNVAGLLS